MPYRILLAAFIYGISWFQIAGLSLSFLSWFAFVPLFMECRQSDSFKIWLFKILSFTITSHAIGFYWYFGLPAHPALLFLSFLQESILQIVPFIFLFFLKKITPFYFASACIVFLYPAWEWGYHLLENTLSIFQISLNQGGNLWLMQISDLFGAWSVTFWTIAINVFFLISFDSVNHVYRKRSAVLMHALLIAIWIIIPLVYSAYTRNRMRKQATGGKNIMATLISSVNHYKETDSATVYKAFKELKQKTDSINQLQKDAGNLSDIYIWYESAVEIDWQDLNRDFDLPQTIKNWNAPLLAGIKWNSNASENAGAQKTNSAILLHLLHGELNTQRYDKVYLTPGWEMIPYNSTLSKLPFFPVSETSEKYLKRGTRVIPFYWKNRRGDEVKIGISICFEQIKPDLWREMTMRDANLFTHLAYEAWFGKHAFEHQFINTTRYRCIENRRAAMRCSNGGVTTFINARGETYALAHPHNPITTATIKLRYKKSFYSRNPYLFLQTTAILSIIILLAGLLWRTR